MLSYIASNSTKDLIIEVCKKLQITILSQIDEVDFLQYIKETKVNFKLIFIHIKNREQHLVKLDSVPLVYRRFSPQIEMDFVDSKRMLFSVRYVIFGESSE